MSKAMKFGTRWHYGVAVLLPAVVCATFLLARMSEAADAPQSLSAIQSRAEIDSLAVTYDPDTPYALPHVLFLIHRQSKHRAYYVNTKLYKFHKDLMNDTYHST